MGLGDGDMTGLILHDILSVIKGHVPEGHKVSTISTVIFRISLMYTNVFLFYFIKKTS